MRQWFPGVVTGRGAIGLLILRLAVGAAFMFHGWSKIMRGGEFVMFHWMGSALPGFLQALAALAEFGGGLLLILGLLTPLAALAIGATMVVALGMVHLPKGHAFVAGKPGDPSFEPALVYLAIMILFLLVGPGQYSLDAVWFRKKHWFFG